MANKTVKSVEVSDTFLEVMGKERPANGRMQQHQLDDGFCL